MNSTTIEKNWDEIKDKLKKKWGKLTNEDIETVEGSFEELTNKLKKVYGFKKAEAEQEIEDFLENLDLKGKAQSLKNTYIKNADTLKEKAEEIFHHSADELNNLKDKTVTMKKETINYAKKNPLKTMAIASFIGLITGFFLHKK